MPNCSDRWRKTRQTTLLSYINEQLIIALLEQEWEESQFDSIEPVDATVNGIEYVASDLYNHEPEPTFHMDMEEYIAHEIKEGRVFKTWKKQNAYIDS